MSIFIDAALKSCAPPAPDRYRGDRGADAEGPESSYGDQRPFVRIETRAFAIADLGMQHLLHHIAAP
jgi:hypothetical protein